MSTISVHWLPIFLSMIASVVLGMLWYGPIFGKKWMTLSGISMPDPKPSMSVMIKPIIISMVAGGIMAYSLTFSLAFAQAYLSMAGPSFALQGSFWNWLGFMVPVLLPVATWEGKGWTLFFIHAVYWLILLSVIALLVVSL